MQELNTIYPYGLNDRIDLHGIKDSYEILMIMSNRIMILPFICYLKTIRNIFTNYNVTINNPD